MTRIKLDILKNNEVSDNYLDIFLCKCKKPKIIEQKGINFCEKCRKEVELFNSK